MTAAAAATWRLLTPPPVGARLGASGAIAAIELSGDVERAARALGFEAPVVGRTALRTIAGVDRGLVARPSADLLLLFPHAGPAILKKLFKALDSAGIQRNESAQDDRLASLITQHSALSTVERRMLAALARTSSPLAIDLLLDQPRRWREEPNPEPRALEARSRILNRLIEPPTIVALGRPNIGKSTLLNTLAGRSVSIVADLPGTTRDHVGVALDLAGLAVRWIDTPGLEAGGLRLEAGGAEELALAQARGADLVVLCEDAAANAQCTTQNAQWVEAASAWDAVAASLSPPAGFIRVRLRADLAPEPPEASAPPAPGSSSMCTVHCALSIPPGAPPRGVETLVGLIRDRLLPPEVLADPGPWALPGAGGESAPNRPPVAPDR